MIKTSAIRSVSPPNGKPELLHSIAGRLSRPAVFIVSLLLAVPGMADIDATRLAAFTERGMALWHVPGMAVAVVSSDEIQFQQGFGQTALEDGQAVDEHTLFAIASTTKAMVVAGILMLLDEEKLSLDDPISKHIPELHFDIPEAGEQIMVRDLLAHRTGLPSTDFWAFFQNMPLDEKITRLHSVTPAAPVRTRLIYQNTMYAVAGLLIERLSGQAWEQFLAERLWQPIGMQETYAARGRIPANKPHVMPYYYIDNELVLADWSLPGDLLFSAGGVWSSIHDMSLWAQFLLRGGLTASGKQLISESSFAQMFEPQQLARPDDFYPTVELTQPHWRSYGLGWFQQDFQGRKIDFHTGSLGGLIALIGLDRDGDRALLVLGNRDHAEMRHALLWDVMDQHEGAQRRDWNQDIFDLYAHLASEREEKWQETQQNRLVKSKPSLKPAAYAGTYRSPSNGDIRIEAVGSRLELNTALISLAIPHWHVDTFLLEYPPWELREFVTFDIGTDGGVASLQLFGDTFVRVEDQE